MILYVTGAGRCGTHLVSSFIAQFTDFHFVAQELVDWKDKLPPIRASQENVIFHCPGTELEAFHRLYPAGCSLLVLRNPIQNYLAWWVADAWYVLRKNTLIYDQSRRDPGGLWEDARNPAEFALRRVVNAFKGIAHASKAARLEDFTKSIEEREFLLSSLIPGARVHAAEDITLNRSTFSRKGIEPVTGKEYPLPLLPQEWDALSRHEHLFAEQYPDWNSNVVVGGGSLERILWERMLFFARNAHDDRVKRTRIVRGLRTLDQFPPWLSLNLYKLVRHREFGREAENLAASVRLA